MENETTKIEASDALSGQVDRLVMRRAKDKKESMFAALVSDNDELFESNGRIIVFGKNKEGENIYLGDVCASVIYQKGVNPMALIERVRFGALRLNNS